MKKIVLFGIGVVLASGCGTLPEADVGACEHLDEAGTAVTAAVSMETAPALSDDHKRNELTFVDVTGGKGGFAKFEADEEGDFFFYLDQDVTLKLTDANNAEVAFEKTEKSIEACTTVKAKYTAELMAGTYSLSFGPTSETTVNVVIEHGEHSHE